MSSLLKPVYMKNSEIQLGRSDRIKDYEILEAVKRTVGDNIKCIQLDRNLWRIYLINKASKEKLLLEGFDLRSSHVSVYEYNPYSSGSSNPADPVLKVTISGIPLSVEDSEITNMLGKFNVSFKSAIRYEKNRNPVTKKMTNVLNGNRFLYIEPLEEGKHLPRLSYCAGLKCRIFHEGQPSNKPKMQCNKCWKSDHFSRDCKNEQCCKVCASPGHEPGSETCPQYEKNKLVTAFQGKDNPLSNFFPFEFRAFGEEHLSVEHAFQFTKALRCGDVVAAEKIRCAPSALDAKRVGNAVSLSVDWIGERQGVMEELINLKAQQCDVFRDKLEKSSVKSLFAEATYDNFWGTGLNMQGTLHTKPDAWPGSNNMGEIIKRVASKYRKKAGNWGDSSQQSMDGFVKSRKSMRRTPSVYRDQQVSDSEPG